MYLTLLGTIANAIAECFYSLILFISGLEKPRTRNHFHSKYTEDLVKIRVTLMKTANNAKQTSYQEMREIRKKYLNFCQSKSKFSQLDHKESEEIRKILAILKLSHPELCSKNEFMKSEDFKSSSHNAFQETTFDRTSDKKNVSKNVFSSFAIPETPKRSVKHPEIDKTNQKKDQTDTSSITPNLREHKQQTPVDIQDDLFQKPSEDEIKKKILQYKLWACELRKHLMN